jgi:hypothetical protein
VREECIHGILEEDRTGVGFGEPTHLKSEAGKYGCFIQGQKASHTQSITCKITKIYI